MPCKHALVGFPREVETDLALAVKARYEMATLYLSDFADDGGTNAWKSFACQQLEGSHGRVLRIVPKT